MAQLLNASDVVVQAKFRSIESSVREDDRDGYVVDLLYEYEVVEYLKGNGPGELTVKLESGPKYNAYPDWFGYRSEEEARGLAENWPGRNKEDLAEEAEGVLLLQRSYQGDALNFSSYDDGRGHGGHPIVGETWLEGEGAVFRHQMGTPLDTTISLEDLKTRIAELGALATEQTVSCVWRVLWWMDRVRAQIEGTYQELTLGGYADPEPFIRFVVTLNAEESQNATVLRLRRPPYRSPRFTHYWLDGEDRDLFDIRASSDQQRSFEAVRSREPLKEGRYSIHYNQYHSSLPCRYSPEWWRADTIELVVVVEGATAR